MENPIKRNINEKSFYELLSDSFYVIPLYQRGYSWDLYNLNTLWEDITHLRDKKYSSPSEHHFMSSILVKDMGDKPKHIVDGQQRITTVMLFLHAAQDALRIHRHRFDANDYPTHMLEKDLERALSGNIIEIDPETNRKIRETPMPRLTLQRVSGSPKQSQNILGNKNKEGFSWTEQEKKGRLYIAYRFFSDKITEMLSLIDGCGKFEDTINVVLHNLYVIYIPILPSEAPQKIFESVNGLTKKLYAGELVKNYLLMSLRNEIETKNLYISSWSDFDEPFWTQTEDDKKRLTKMLYYWILSKNGKKIEDMDDESVYRAVKDYASLSSFSIDAASKRAIEISKDIHRTLTLMTRLEKKKHTPQSRLELSYNRLYTMKEPKNSQAVFMKFLYIIVSLEDHFKVDLNDDQFNRLLLPLESYIIRKCMIRHGYSGAVTENLLKITQDAYFQRADHSKIANLDAYSSIDDFLDKHVFSFIQGLNDKKDKRHRFETNNFLLNYVVGDRSKGIFPDNAISTDLAHVLLVQVEHHLSKNGFMPKGKHLSEKFTIEHWLPQQSSAKTWPLRDEAARTIYTNSIGNLCIIPQSINSILSNKPLEEKLDVVMKIQGNSDKTGFETLDKVIRLCMDDKSALIWDETKIEQRAKWIIELVLTKIFPDTYSLGKLNPKTQGIFNV